MLSQQIARPVFSLYTNTRRTFSSSTFTLHKKSAVYGNSARMSSISPAHEGGQDFFMFGPYKINTGEVFLRTEHSFAFVNLRPVVPGHVLVSSKRIVPRFAELTDEEAIDLWLTAKRIGAKLEPHFCSSSLTFGIQDGPHAGQTVPHVHIHILPRKAGDFKVMDDVYDEMNQKEQELAKKLDLDEEKKDRNRDEMAAEAEELRRLF